MWTGFSVIRPKTEKLEFDDAESTLVPLIRGLLSVAKLGVCASESIRQLLIQQPPGLVPQPLKGGTRVPCKAHFSGLLRKTISAKRVRFL